MPAASQEQRMCTGILRATPNSLTRESQAQNSAFWTQALLVSSRGGHPHLIAGRYWGLSTNGGCAGRGRLDWPGESRVSLTHAHTFSHLCKQRLRSQSHRWTFIIQMILNNTWPDGVVAAYFVWDDVTRVQILVRP